VDQAARAAVDKGVTPISTAFAGPGQVLPPAAAAVAALMLTTWALSLRLRDASIVDPVWGPAFVLVALVAALTGDGDPARRWLLAGLTAAWGLRLGVHLTRRKLGDRAEDRRYAEMRARHPRDFARWSLVAVFGTQGLLVLVVSLPLQVGAQRPGGLGAVAVAGVALWALGLGFEAIGDEQLRRFKADPASRGQVMDRGLWRYTRHPNYFGDACVWWGLWLVAAGAGATWWTAIGPAVMTLFLVRVSGKGLLERDIAERRPGYAGYVQRTSGFIPLPPRRPAAPGGSG
jgi:steroid 5-alpha reductase family enzyme